MKLPWQNPKLMLRPALCSALITVLITTLSACSWFGDSDDAGVAASLPPLDVPPDLIKPATNPRYQPTTLPPAPATQTVSAGATAQPAGNGGVIPQWQGVERLRDGQVRWLRVSATAEQLWPQLTRFLTERGYAIAQNEPAVGFVETAWTERDPASNAGQTGWREILRLRVEAAEAGKTDVYLTQKNSQQVDGQWQVRDTDNERAIELLSRLAQVLGANQVVPGAQAATQAAALAPTAPALPTLPSTGEPTAAERAAMDQRWEQIGRECALCRPR